MSTRALMYVAISLMALSCSDSNFLGNKKTSPPPNSEGAAPLSDVQPSQDAEAENPGVKKSKPTDCTGLEAIACKDKKKEEGAENSVRVINCSGKAAGECEQAVATEVERDGDNNSTILVKGCSEAQQAECNRIVDNFSKDHSIKVLSEQEVEEILTGSVTTDTGTGTSTGTGTITTDTGTGTSTGTGTITTDTGITVTPPPSIEVENSGDICLGGPAGRITVIKKTAQEARGCMQAANSKPCANDPKCGWEHNLQQHKCICSKPSGLDYNRPCRRHNPQRAGHPSIMTECKLIR